jgi:hypothetical protein
VEYVDDIIIAGDDLEGIVRLKQFLQWFQKKGFGQTLIFSKY